MKPTRIRRSRRITSALSEGKSHKNESQREQPFFGMPIRETFFQPANNVVQRKCEHCEEEDKKLQREPEKKEDEKKLMRAEERKEKIHRAADKKEEEKKLQRQPEKKEEEKLHKKESSSSNAVAVNTTPNYVNSLNGKGQPLSKQQQYFFGSRMGYNFNNVKVHTDKEAAQSATEVNAKAYTYGNSIVFNEGQYNAESGEGRKLLAHELVHIVQQDKTGKNEINRETICGEYLPDIPDAISSGPVFSAQQLLAAQYPNLYRRLPGEAIAKANNTINWVLDDRRYKIERAALVRKQYKAMYEQYPDMPCVFFSQTERLKRERLQLENKKIPNPGWDSGQVAVEAEKVIDMQELLTIPQYNKRDEQEYRRSLFRQLISKPVMLIKNDKFEPDKGKGPDNLYYYITWNGIFLPNTGGKVTFENLKDTVEFGAAYYREVVDGPTQRSLEAMTKELWSGWETGRATHFHYIQMRDDAEIVHGVRTLQKVIAPIGMGEYIEPTIPPYKVWDEISELLLQAMTLGIDRQSEPEAELLLTASEKYNDAVQRLDYYNAMDMASAGQTLKGLYYIKGGSALAISILSGGAFAVEGAGMTRVILGSSAMTAGYNMTQEAFQQAAGGNINAADIIKGGVKDFALNVIEGGVGHKASEMFKVLAPVLSKLGPTAQRYIPQLLGGVTGGVVSTTADVFFQVLTSGKEFSIEELEDKLKEAIVTGGIQQILLDGIIGAYNKTGKVKASMFEQYERANTFSQETHPGVSKETIDTAADMYRKGLLPPDHEVNLKNFDETYQTEMKILEREAIAAELPTVKEKAGTRGNVKAVEETSLTKDYDIEITIGEHTYRRKKADKSWCRFSRICNVDGLEDINDIADRTFWEDNPDLPEGTHKIVDDPNADYTSGSNSPAEILGASMEAAGKPGPENYEPHHIVAERDPRAKKARDILDQAGIGVNQDVNGVWLPRTSRETNARRRTKVEAFTSHDEIHTDAYFKEVAKRLEIAMDTLGPDGIHSALERIGIEIEIGIFPR